MLSLICYRESCSPLWNCVFLFAIEWKYSLFSLLYSTLQSPHRSIIVLMFSFWKRKGLWKMSLLHLCPCPDCTQTFVATSSYSPSSMFQNNGETNVVWRILQHVRLHQKIHICSVLYDKILFLLLLLLLLFVLLALLFEKYSLLLWCLCVKHLWFI